MSLTLALNNALSSLRVNQSALNVLSQNISNANTEGYSRQILALEAQYIDNKGAGVRISDIVRNVDLYLQQTVVRQTTATATTAVVQSYMDRAQILMGEPANENSLNAFLDNFFSSMQDLADNPDRSSIRETALAAGMTVAREMSTLALELQRLRFEADQDINRDINIINETLRKIFDVNVALSNADALKQSKVGLLDERDLLVKKLSEYLDIRVRYQRDGGVHVTAAGGIGLVDYQLHQLSYRPVFGVDSFIDNAPTDQILVTPVDRRTLAAVGKPQVLVDRSTAGQLNTPMREGKLYGLLQIRDIKIPEFLNTLDTLAFRFREAVNAIHNDGTGFPPPSNIIGQVAVDPQEARAWLGEVRIAVLNNNGTPLNNPYDVNNINIQEQGGFRPLSLNFGFNSGEGESGRHTAQTIVDEFNAYFGPQQAKWELGNLSNIRLVSNISNIPPTNQISLDFNFENISDQLASVEILSATINAAPVAVPVGSYASTAGSYTRTGQDWGISGVGVIGMNVIEVQVQVTDEDGNVRVDTLTFNFDNSVPTEVKNQRIIATASAGGDAVQHFPTIASPIAVAEIVDANGNPAATGEFGYIRLRTFNANHGIAINEETSRDNGRLWDTPPLVGTGRGFSHYFGLNNFFDENNNFPNDEPAFGNDNFKNSAYNLSVREVIQRNSNLISTGRLQLTHTPEDQEIPFYTYELGIGGKQAVQRMADLGLRSLNFADSGILPASQLTISSFASSFLGAAAAQADFADQNFKQNNFLLQGYLTRSDAISGVNIDEEVGNTIIYQNAYAASARIISVVNIMFDALINAT